MPPFGLDKVVGVLGKAGKQVGGVMLEAGKDGISVAVQSSTGGLVKLTGDKIEDVFEVAKHILEQIGNVVDQGQAVVESLDAQADRQERIERKVDLLMDYCGINKEDV